MLLLLITQLSHAQNISIVPTRSQYQGGNNIRCHGASDGWINIVIVDGVPPYLFNWSTNTNNHFSFNQNLSNLPAGEYTVVVTDMSNQTASMTIAMHQPGVLTVQLEPREYEGGYNVSESGGQNGVIESHVSGGTQDYTYLWSNAETEYKIGGLPAGNYHVSVTDINNCTASAAVTLIEPTPLQLVSISSPQFNGYNISCRDGHDGTINLSVSGGTLLNQYSFEWSNGSREQNPSDLSAGIYSVVVRDANEASLAAQIQLTEPPEFRISSITAYVYPNGKNLSCYTCSNGSLTANTTGGTGSVTYHWETGQTTQTISNLSAATYIVTATDANGCSVTASKIVTAPERDDWSMNGNANIDSVINFMGTTDNRDMIFKTNNFVRLNLTKAGEIKLPGMAGSTMRMMLIDGDGNITPGDPFDPNPVSPLCTWHVTNPWHRANTIWPLTGANDVINCEQRFGFGAIAPQERIHVAGFARFTSVPSAVNYLNIGFDGNSKINSFGTDLFINYESPRHVMINTGTISGDVQTGGNTFLATVNPNGKVCIGSSVPHPESKLQVDHDLTKGGLFINRLSNATEHSEIRFNQEGNEKWALGCDLFESGSHDFFLWNHHRFLAGFQGLAISVDAANNVAIDGPAQSSTKLLVNGNIHSQSGGNNSIRCTSIDASEVSLSCANTIWNYGLTIDGNGTGHITSGPSSAITIGMDGAVGINFDPNAVPTPPHDADYKLYVEGSIAAREIKVTAGDFPDYVFEKDYPLMSIADLKKFVGKHNHLPDIPSEKEITSANGFEIGRMQTLLLKKVEEQTLYIFELQRQIDELRREVNRAGNGK